MARPVTITRAMPGIRRFLHYLRPYLRGYRALLFGALVMLVGQAFLRLLEPWPLKFIIDRVVGRTHGVAGDGHGLLAALGTSEFLALAATSLVVITGLRAVCGYYTSIGFALVGNGVLTRLRDELFRHIQSLSLAFHDRNRSGDLVMRMVGDVGMIREVAVTAIMPLAGNVLVLTGMLAVMLWLHWQLALVVVLTLPLLLLATLRRSRHIQSASRSNRQREGAMAAAVSESVGAIRTVQALSLADRFADSFSGANSRSLKEGVKVKRLTAGLERSVDLMIAVATAVVLWYGAHLVLAAELTPGELLVFVFYLRRAFRPMRDFAKYTARLAKASAAGERVLELLEQEAEVRERPDAVVAPVFAGRIGFHGIDFGYGPERQVLHGIDTQIAAGEQVAIVGPSGSGKSTLAGLVTRLYDPGAGCVTIDGRDIRDYTLNSLRGQIAFVLQDSLLFAASIRDNICAGLDGVSDADIETAARLANAHDFISRLPAGYDTVVGERGTTLSNGQRQRIAIARAAIRQTSILILDEPTTGLDPAGEQAVNEALQRLCAGHTTLTITHRADAAARADRVLFVCHGRIVAEGRHEDLLHGNRDYARLFGHAAVPLPAAAGRAPHAVGG